MDACMAVEREQEKVLKKLKTLSGSYAYKLQILIDQIAQLRGELGKPTLSFSGSSVSL